jgi:hypothetical protein
MAVADALHFSRRGLTIVELSAITGLSTSQCSAGTWRLTACGDSLLMKGFQSRGGSRWWHVEWRDDYERAVSERAKQFKRNSNARQRDKKQGAIAGEGGDDWPVVQVTVPAAQCRAEKPGPASVWELAA